MVGPDITLLLNRAADGDSDAASIVWTAVHREVHAMAVNAVRNEPKAVNLEASAVVSEVFIRFAGKRTEVWESRAHFFGSIARSMEQFLIDTARAMQRQQRRFGVVGESVAALQSALANEGAQSEGDALELLLLFGQLEAESPIAATVVRLRYQFNLSLEEVATALVLTSPQVDHLSRFGRAFIRTRMAQKDV